MQMNDRQSIASPRDEVWAALNDPNVLQRWVPGCQTLEMSDSFEMTATVAVKLGPVQATFKGKVSLRDIDAPNGYPVIGVGSGGTAGFAEGGATVRLEAEGPDATILHDAVESQVGGKLARLGSRMVHSVAKKLANEFFVAFSATLEGRA